MFPLYDLVSFIACTNDDSVAGMLRFHYKAKPNLKVQALKGPRGMRIFNLKKNYMKLYSLLIINKIQKYRKKC